MGASSLLICAGSLAGGLVSNNNQNQIKSTNNTISSEANEFSYTAEDWANLTYADIAQMCGVYNAAITDEIDLLDESAITQYISEHMSVNMLKYLIVTDVYTAACVASRVNEWQNNSSAIISLKFDTIEENSDGTYNLDYTISGYQPSDMNMNGFEYQMSSDDWSLRGAFTCNLYYGTYTANNISFTNSTYNIELWAYRTSADINTIGIADGGNIICNDGSADIQVTYFCNSAFGSGFWSFSRGNLGVSDQFAEIKTYHTWENFLLGAFPNLKFDSNTNVGLAVGLGVGLGVPAVGGIGFGIYYGVKKKKNKK